MPRAPPGAWDEEDEWYSSDRYAARYVRPPPPPPPRPYENEYLPPRGREHLVPGGTVSYGLHRSRSQGHAPAPNVTIYNTLDADQQPRISTTQQGPPSPPARGRPADTWAIEEQLAELRMEQARQRSRSRGHFDRYHHDHERVEHVVHERTHSPNYQQRVELELAKERLRKKEEELEEEKMRDAFRKEYELKREREERKREGQERKREEREREEEEEKRRIIEENTRKLERSERDAKAAKQRAIDEWAKQKAEEEAERKAAERRAVDEFNRKKEKEDAELKAARQKAVDEYNMKKEKDAKEAKEAKQRALDEYQRKAREKEEEEKAERDRVIAEYHAKQVADEKKQKELEEALIVKLAKQKEEKERKEKEAYEAFLAKQKAKEAEEKAKKEAAEKEFEEKFSQRLAQSGFQYNQIQAMMKPEKPNNMSPGFLPNNPMQIPPPPPAMGPPPIAHQPTFIKIHKDYLSIDTLTYFSVPWKYDERDPNYFILLREMDSRETDALFEHTQRLRTRTTTQLLIEERGDRHSRPEYAFVRHKSKRAVSRDPSPGRRRRSSPKHRTVGLKLF